MKPTSTLRPSASSPWIDRRAVGNHVPLLDLVPELHDGLLIEAGAFVESDELLERVDIGANLDAAGITIGDFAGAAARITMLELVATSRSMPVATIGGSVINSGTACRCMFEPINARLASSCSRKGIKPAETPTIWLGATSMYWTSSGFTMRKSAR